MRGRFLLAAALLLVVPSPGRADEEPRAEADRSEVLRFLALLQEVEVAQGGWSAVRPSGRRSDARTVAVFAMGAGSFEAVLDGLSFDQHVRLVTALSARGWRLDRILRWADPPPTAEDLDAAALVAGDGRLPEGFVPAGREAPGEVPPLSVLGGTVVLEIVAGGARARVTAAPEGSRAREIGLREGDVLLEVDGDLPGPRTLGALDDSALPTGQHSLKVRRTHGGIERIVIDSWDGRLPAR